MGLTVREALAMATPVYLEVGKSKVFACALDWPGWCRSAKTEEDALEVLASYRDRYAVVADEAGVRFPVRHTFEVVERVKGNATTDFGAPGVVPKADEGLRLTAKQADRLARLFEASWRVFDRVAAGAPAALKKGPRGGGRDTAKIVDHVRDAQKGYGPKLGLAPNERDLEHVAAYLRAAPADSKWPVRYAARRLTWHVLDHAWEIEDRS
jgi:hypothetical protein